MKNFHVSSLNFSYNIDQCTLRFFPKTDLKLYLVSKNRKYQIENKNAPSDIFLSSPLRKHIRAIHKRRLLRGGGSGLKSRVLKSTFLK